MVRRPTNGQSELLSHKFTLASNQNKNGPSPRHTHSQHRHRNTESHHGLGNSLSSAYGIDYMVHRSKSKSSSKFEHLSIPGAMSRTGARSSLRSHSQMPSLKKKHSQLIKAKRATERESDFSENELLSQLSKGIDEEAIKNLLEDNTNCDKNDDLK